MFGKKVSFKFILDILVLLILVDHPLAEITPIQQWHHTIRYVQHLAVLRLTERYFEKNKLYFVKIQRKILQVRT